MKNEIKEILDIKSYLGTYISERQCKYTKLDKHDKAIKILLDYITNLETIEQQYSAILSENVELENKITNLEQENESKDNKILELQQELLNKKLNVKDIEYKEKMIYKLRIDKTIDKIQYIIDYGFDYDGFNTVESLKGLIDMLVDYARQSKDILQGDKE